MASIDAPYWAWVRKLRIDGRPFTLEGRKYQLEIMRPVTDDGKVKKNEVIRKGSQIGITMGKVMEISHGALHGTYPQGIIYYFPSAKAVEHFSKTRFKPFLDDNPEEVKKYVNDVNAVAVRRIGSVNVNFFGASGTYRVGGEKKDSTSVRSTPADWVLLDERDLFDDEMAQQVNQRLGNSTIKRRSDIGTPTIPEIGVDLLYKKSDQRRWQIKCESCDKHTCLETEGLKCIRLEPTPHLICIHCGSEILRSNGKWVPDYPDRPTVGYWASQLLNPNCDLALVLSQFRDPEAYDTSEAELKRTVMGEPYISTEDRLSESDIYSCCNGEMMSYSHTGPCAMGVDVGDRLLHVLIGHNLDRKRKKIVKIARVPIETNWDNLIELGRRFGVKSCVVDALPQTQMARAFQQKAPFAVFLCFYSEHQKTFDEWNNDNVVKVNRTEVFDETHHLVTYPGRFIVPRVDEEVKEFAHQMTMAAKVLETDLRTGTKCYRYRKVGDKEDHYRNAVNYFYLACKKVGIPQEVSKQKRITSQDMSYAL